MPTYEAALADDPQYMGNAVLRIAGVYYCIRQPDSGLTIPRSHQRTISSLVVNPNTIDPKRVSTTIGSYSFTLVDKNGIVSRVIKDTGADILGQTVELWLGRSGVGMAFSDYYRMPDTRISRCSNVDSGWSFSTKESTDRMNRPVYDLSVRLSGDIVAGTNVITAKDDISDFPSAGLFRIEDELISYSSKNDGTKTFSGCARGEFGTTPAEHADNEAMLFAETITDNPINIILKLLTSGSGSGSYDALDDGLAIDPALIDITEIEALRDTSFSGVSFSLALYSITNALQFIEEQLLAPCNLRFTFSRSSLLTLKQLNSPEFIPAIDTLDHDSIVGTPQMVIENSKVVNRITVQWDYDEGTGRYLNNSVYTDEDSIAAYGKTTSPLSFSFKGVSDEAFVDAFAEDLLDRLSTPKPEVDVKAFVSKSLLNVCDKGRVETTKLPNSLGDLNFAADMEIISRAINFKTGEVKFKLVYTGFTSVRLGYIAPSDTIQVITAQDVVEFGAGRGDLYEAGWKVRLWNNLTNAFESDAVNEIASIDGDEITFVDEWVTTLTTDHRIRFAQYDNVSASQKRYAFISATGSDFSATEQSYKIVP